MSQPAGSLPSANGAVDVSSSPLRLWRWRLAAGLGLVAGFTGLVVFLTMVSIHAVLPNSDSASVLLVGQSLAHGNVFLRGWALSLDSFWTVDTPFYAIADRVGGLRPSLLSVVPAVIAALVVLVGGALAAEGTRRGARWAGFLTVVAILAFPTHAMATFFLQGPLHSCTALWVLVAFWTVRHDRFGWQWGIAVLALTAGTLGDLQTVVYGTLPVALAGCCAMGRRRTSRTGIATISAALGATGLAFVVREVADIFGTFSIGSPNPTANLGQIGANIGRFFTHGAELLGVTSTVFGTGGVPGWLQSIHVPGALVVLACVLMATGRLLRGVRSGATHEERIGEERWRLDDLLLLACLGATANFLVLTLDNSPAFSRYLMPVIIFAAVLSGRVVADGWSRTKSPTVRRATGIVGLAALVAFSAGDAVTLRVPPPAQPVAHLVTWLRAHHLTTGLGDYWSASITTVQSDGKVTVRPVLSTPHLQVLRYPRESEASWYDNRFSFLVFNTADIWLLVDTASATATWGPPAHIYNVGTYRVLVWPTPISVAP